MMCFDALENEYNKIISGSSFIIKYNIFLFQLKGFIVIHLMTSCFDVAMSTCRMSKERQSYMQPVNTPVIKVTKLYDSFVTKDQEQCIIRCFSEPDCFYLSQNSAGSNCTLYSRGSTILNASGLLTLAVHYKFVKVSNL